MPIMYSLEYNCHVIHAKFSIDYMSSMGQKLTLEIGNTQRKERE